MDIVYVTYNSSKWIEKCFSSIEKLDYDISKLNIWVVDNASTDNTLEKLEMAKEGLGGRVAGFEIIKSEENLGFGSANNLGFLKGNDDIVCFFNIDTELEKHSLKKLEKEINYSIENEPKVAVWELRQFPYEHPKMYNPITLETSWCSGAAFVVKRRIFEQVQGFDNQLFMYAEDVDLSWRIRSYGYTLKYVPKAVIYHHSYETAGEIKPNQYINAIINNIFLRYRFGSFLTVIIGYLGVIRCLLRTEAYEGSRKQLYTTFVNHFSHVKAFKQSRKLGALGKNVATFIKFSYCETREGAFYYNELPKEKPLVTVVIDLEGNKELLDNTLATISNQTYENIEVVVKDADMTENQVDEKSHGDYMISIKEGTLLFADAVEVLVSLQKNSNSIF